MTTDVPTVDSVPISGVELGATRRFWLSGTHDELGSSQRVPLMVRQGAAPGPVLVLTAVIHGNELNGMRAIQEVFAHPSAASLDRGTLVAVPIVNIPGFRRHQREYADDKDLNRFVKEDDDGRPAQRFAFRFATTILNECDCLLDLHTAGGGRRNMFYARVDLDDEPSRELATWVAPPLIAHKPPREDALRGFAAEKGIRAAVLEIGDPNCFQPPLITDAVEGILRTLRGLEILSADVPEGLSPTVCPDSYWVRAAEGGTAVTTVTPGETVTAGQRVAVVRNVWGDITEELVAPRAGTLVGVIRQPIVLEGSPVAHIGVTAAADDDNVE